MTIALDAAGVALLLEHVGVPIGMLDDGGRLVDRNRALDELLGDATIDEARARDAIARAGGCVAVEDLPVRGLSAALCPIAGGALLIVRGLPRDRLLERALAAQEQERRHLARELHDQAGSALAAMLLSVHALGSARTLDEARSAASRLETQLSGTLDDLARLARGLHPLALEQIGLAPSLSRGIASVARESGLTVEVAVDLGDTRLASSVEIAVYRIAQEAVTNVIRHARARSLSLACRVEDGEVVLAIVDDGRGFDPAAVAPGRMGLAGIRDRAALLGGVATIESSPGRGTAVRARLPFRSAVGVP
jgi:signal transduction histidine kinase